MAYNIKDVINAETIKNTLLVGINLTDDDGNAYPDELFDSAIDQAISVLESDLQITIDPYRTKGERHDAVAQNRRSWWSMSMDRRPLRSVDKLTISYGNYPETDVPLEWVNITSEVGGSLSLIPTAAVLGSFNFSNSIPLLIDPISNFSYHERVPAYFKFDYTSGFNFIEKEVIIPAGQTVSELIEFGEILVDKPNFSFELYNVNSGNIQSGISVKQFNVSNEDFQIEIGTALFSSDLRAVIKIHTLPQAMIKAISYVAAMLPLDTAGDLLLGAGIATQNISIDGLSQAISSTASATSSGYGARIISYNQQLKTTMSALRNKYTLPKFAVF
jgi:hypothetical protein